MSNAAQSDSSRPHSLAAFLDFFLPSNIDNRTQLRERVLAGYVFIQAILGALTAAAILSSDWPWDSRWQAAFITGGQSVGNLLLLFGLRQGLHRTIVINGVVALGYAIFISAVIATGGVYATTIPLLLIFVACFAFCLGGVRAGLVWSLIILLTLGVISQISISTALLVHFTASDLRQMSALIFVLTLVSIGAILLIYEKIYGRYGQQLRLERQSFYNQAHTDTLTGLANLRGFENVLQLRLADARESGNFVTLAYMDLDGFKAINDTLGHDVGDWLLKEVAKRLDGCLRPNDVGARLGGDEFAIVISGLNSIDQSDKVVMRLREAVSLPVFHNGTAIPFGISLGSATFPLQVQSGSELIRLADQRMYLEKRARRSRHVPVPSESAASTVFGYLH